MLYNDRSDSNLQTLALQGNSMAVSLLHDAIIDTAVATLPTAMPTDHKPCQHTSLSSLKTVCVSSQK